MKEVRVLAHEFVALIPEDLKEGVIYVSIEYAIVAHKCCCGCGNEVATPLSPTDWKLIYDGKTISLEPSIGNWSFDCQSHYWINSNRVTWVRGWSREEILAGRSRDRLEKERYFNGTTIGPSALAGDKASKDNNRGSASGMLQRLKKRLRWPK